MNTGLPDFLRAIAAEPFVLGRSDCMTWLADWVVRERNIPDPIAEYRGTYDTPKQWKRLTDGALAPFVDQIAKSVGIWTTAVPMVGDIGVVTLGRLDMGAIMGRRGWIVRAGFRSGEPGIGLAPNAITVAAWRV